MFYFQALDEQMTSRLISEARLVESGRSGDLVDRPHVGGRALLASGREFPCLARNISVAAVEIVGETGVEAGQVVICSLNNIGILPGRVAGRTPTGFVATLNIPAERRARVMARLEWHARNFAREADLRRAVRIVPVHRSIEVRLGERIVLPGLIRNISLSGAAIGLGEVALPFVGAHVRVGSRYATVVRQIENGIAVHFIEPFPASEFDERVRP